VRARVWQCKTFSATAIAYSSRSHADVHLLQSDLSNVLDWLVHKSESVDDKERQYDADRRDSMLSMASSDYQLLGIQPPPPQARTTRAMSVQQVSE